MSTPEKDNKFVKLFNEAYSNVLNKENTYTVEVKFSSRFKKFNGKLVLFRNKKLFELRLSNEWKNISNEIVKGLIEELIAGLFKKNYHSFNIEIYRRFIRNLDLTNSRVEEESDKELLESFKRVNEKYFNNSLDVCLVKFGNESTTKLGEYNYHSDKITISKVLKDAPQRLLDYVMYHEMIHKYLKLSIKGKTYHSKEFKQLESKYEGWPQVEKELTTYIKKVSFRSKPTRRKKSSGISSLFNFFKKNN
ncbi:MAG: hypothetical protein PWP03_129 [Candidatus Woesearchaeota archaeon]|nr:hypothetical protein [Candidatus Woesearchaeota archaeon]MDN5327491.1 hypothetical protein [Candidatus Woesearchaeota archaeon]